MLKLSIFILISILGIFFRKSKLYFLITILALGWLTLISPNVADFKAYENVYNFIGTGNLYLNTGYGWWFLCRIGNLLQFNYAQFKFVVLVIGLLLIWSTIWYLKLDDNLIMATYIIYPAITDLIQIRFFVATSIVIFFLRFLLKNTKWNYMLYIFGVLLAAQVHTSAYFYLMFVLCIYSVKHFKVTCIVTIGALSLFWVRKNLVISLISRIGTEQESSFYLNSQYYASFNDTLMFVFTTIFFFLISIYMYKTYINGDILKKNLDSQIELIRINFLKFLIGANYVSIFIVLLSSLAFTFLRLQKPLWILNYMGLAIISSRNIKSKISPNILNIIYVCLALLWILASEQQALTDFFFSK
ncbi:EpsG family protein [Limosilactobacillus reuteri]|uniref:EpsG family protein n=1 Tax=Limosilactobacillus reuteri TaxID=1598 RepID=UPI001E644775|nr:EpsG family protein [Limosilactobacillus reuteri]MCC4439774.1 EpsG family protein [Limosilactobacillus reuteri]